MTVGDNTVFKKVDPDLQIVWAEVYVPDIPDTDGEFMSVDTVRKAAHDFLAQNKAHKIDTKHNNDENGSYVVESFIARKGDKEFIEGSWVVGVHIPDTKLWKKVKDGELNGFSLEAKATRIKKTLTLEVPENIEGKTFKSEGHTHKFSVIFNGTGNTISGHTSTVEGHSHPISKGTLTEEVEGHSHKYSFVEAIANGK